MPSQIIILLLAMVPTVEARFALPIGLLKYDLTIFESFFFPIVGNLLAIVLMLFLLFEAIKRIKWEWFNNLINKIFKVTKKKHNKFFKTFEDISLITLIAIPLPGSGIYTGCVLCYLLGLTWKRTLVLNTVGMLISTTIALITTAGIDALFFS